MWSGTAASWVDLNPSGSVESEAHSISGGQQVGLANFGGEDHAGLWSGSAGSWVDLHPSGAARSTASDIADGQQVGNVSPGLYPHASLWTGSAASWVDLNPSGSTLSSAWGVASGRQVGYARIGTYDHAGIWNGTPESWLDLHSFLTADYVTSRAYAIEVTGSDIWIAGTANNLATGEREAILWHNVVPEPSSILILGSGILALAGFIRRKR